MSILIILASTKLDLVSLQCIKLLFVDCEGKDIIFVVDRSGGICNNKPVFYCENWQSIIRFLDGIVEDLDIGSGFNAMRVGVVVYGNNAVVEISLADVGNLPDLRAAISGINYLPKEGTNTSGGLLLMMQHFEEHDRSYIATKIAVLITGGKSTIDSVNTVASAIEAKNRGIAVFAIGVTDMVDEKELQLISSNPQFSDVNFFTRPTFESLESIVSSVGSHIKGGKLCKYLDTRTLPQILFQERSIHIRHYHKTIRT